MCSAETACRLVPHRAGVRWSCLRAACGPQFPCKRAHCGCRARWAREPRCRAACGLTAPPASRPPQAPKPFTAARGLSSKANGIAAAPRPTLAAQQKQQQPTAASLALRVECADGPRGMKLKTRKVCVCRERAEHSTAQHGRAYVCGYRRYCCSVAPTDGSILTASMRCPPSLPPSTLPPQTLPPSTLPPLPPVGRQALQGDGQRQGGGAPRRQAAPEREAEQQDQAQPQVCVGVRWWCGVVWCVWGGAGGGLPLRRGGGRGASCA